MKSIFTTLSLIGEKCIANFRQSFFSKTSSFYSTRFARATMLSVVMLLVFNSVFSQIGMVVCPGTNVTFAPKDGLGPYAWYTNTNAGASPLAISNTYNYGVLNYNETAFLYYYDKYYNLHIAYAKAAPTIDSTFTTSPGACLNVPQLFNGNLDVWGTCFSGDGNTTGAGVDGAYPTTQTTNVSLTARVKWNGGTSGSQWIVLNGNAGTNGYGLLIDASSKKLLVILGGTKIINSNLTLVTNKWQQLALIRKGIRWCVSVNFIDYDLNDSTNPAPVGNGGFYVGQDNNNGARFNGKIDEVSAFNGVLDGATLALQGSPFQNVTPQSLWHFDEGSGTTAMDAGPNHLNLTLKTSSYGSVSNYVYSVSNNANGEANQSFTFKVLGQTGINLNITDSYGCTPTDSYNTNVIVNNTVPVVPTPVASANPICVGDPVDLTISGSGLLLSNTFNNTAGVGWSAGPGWTSGASIRDFHPSFTYTTRDGSEIFGLFADGAKYNSSLTSPAFSTLNSTGIQIVLDHYIIPGDAADFFVEMSTDNTNWTNLIQFGGNGVGQGTYTNFALSTINVPTAFENKAQVYLRFRYVDPANYGTNIYTGWYINNLIVYRGAVPPSFTWTSSPSGFTSSQQNNFSVKPLVSTTYYVSQSTGCSSGQASITVNVNPLPSATIAGSTAICQNSTAPNITFTGTGSAAPYTFTYNINGGTNQTITSASNNATATVTAPTNTAGNFTYNLIKVTSNLGCSQTLSLSSTITVRSLPTATISVPASVCAGSNVITFTATGGTAPYTFLFNYSGSAFGLATFTSESSNSVTNPAPSVAGPATYTITGVNDNYCSTSYSGSASPTATINVNALPAATLGTIPIINAASTSFSIPYTITSGSPDRYSITKGSTNTMPNFVAVNNAVLTGGNIVVTIPATASGTYNFNLTLKNNTTTCTSTTIPFTVTVAYNKLNSVGLDYNTTASPAYSLRLLSSDYKGKAINVRRSSDNTLLDIGFTINGDLDTTALKNFVGTGNGFVTKWYDQSGHTYDATQATATTQPSIITAGVVQRINSKPAIYFGTANLATAKTTIFTAGASMVGVAKGNSTISSALITKTGTSAGVNPAYPSPFDFTNNTDDFVVGSAFNTSSYNAIKLNTVSPQANVNSQVPASIYGFTIPTSGTYYVYRNGTQAASNTVLSFTDNGNSLMIGNRNDLGSSGNLWTPEIVLFNSVLSTTDRQNIENSQRGYYISPETVYVDSANGNDNDVIAGTSWTKAYKTLSKALFDAHISGSNIKTILIAKGSYYAAGTATASTSYKDSTFYIYRNALKIYGGYNASTGARDISANKVYLDGIGNTGHILMLSGIPAGDSIVIDGLTIYNGNASNDRPVLLYNGNSVNGNSGGGLNVRSSNTLGSKIAFRNCAFLNNYGWNGGAAFIENSSPVFTNCLFANNAGPGGGAVLFDYNLANTLLINCTIANNSSDYSNSLFYSSAKSVVTMYNSIIWGGTVNIYNSDIVDKLITDSCIIQGGYGAGTHISVADPMFVDPDNGNFRLLAQSPAINTGSKADYIGPNTDVDGKPRIIGAIDMGAYESQPNNLDKVTLTASTIASPAYSLRLLSTAYTGKAINVCRSSDSTFMDIGFTPNGDLDTATLKTFIGTKTGYVTSWYDQSGFGYDALQTDTSRQPRIITAGVIERINGKPAIYFGTANLGTVKATIFTSGASMVGVAKGNSSGSSAFITKTGTLAGTNLQYPAPFDFTNEQSLLTVGDASTGAFNYIALGSTSPKAYVNNNTPASIFSFVIPVSGTYYTYLNGAQSASNTVYTFVDNGNSLRIGTRNDFATAGNFWTPEILLFNSVLDTTSRKAAETSQKNYYMTATVLPVTLLSFTGMSNNGSNFLYWTTATETNNSGFYVERSTDGINFTDLSFINGIGNSNSINSYNYTDNQTINGNDFYRLKQVDKDGMFTYSNIVKLTTANRNLVTVYPNPTKANVTITIGNNLLSTKATLFGINGRMLQEFPITNSSFTIDLSSYAGGVYLLKMADGTIAKIIKE